MTQITKRRSLTPRLAAACCAPIDGMLEADLFKGLSDPTRLKLFGCIAKCGRACSVTEVAECCDVDFSVISRHLALLERSGIVQSTKKGRTVFYSVEYGPVAAKLRKLADALSSYDPESRAKNKGACCG